MSAEFKSVQKEAGQLGEGPACLLDASLQNQLNGGLLKGSRTECLGLRLDCHWMTPNSWSLLSHHFSVNQGQQMHIIHATKSSFDVRGKEITALSWSPCSHLHFKLSFKHRVLSKIKQGQESQCLLLLPAPLLSKENISQKSLNSCSLYLLDQDGIVFPPLDNWPRGAGWP